MRRTKSYPDLPIGDNDANETDDFANDDCHPTQWRDLTTRASLLTGEKKLCLTLVISALNDLRGPTDTLKYTIAYEWLTNPDDEAPITLRACCDLLGSISADAIANDIGGRFGKPTGTRTTRYGAASMGTSLGYDQIDGRWTTSWANGYCGKRRKAA